LWLYKNSEKKWEDKDFWQVSCQTHQMCQTCQTMPDGWTFPDVAHAPPHEFDVSVPNCLSMRQIDVPLDVDKTILNVINGEYTKL